MSATMLLPIFDWSRLLTRALLRFAKSAAFVLASIFLSFPKTAALIASESSSFFKSSTDDSLRSILDTSAAVSPRDPMGDPIPLELDPNWSSA